VTVSSLLMTEGLFADGTLEQLQQDFRGSEKISLELKLPAGKIINVMTEIYSKFKRNFHRLSRLSMADKGKRFATIFHTTVKGSEFGKKFSDARYPKDGSLLEMSRKATEFGRSVS